jgi:ribosome biogenesis protein Nip4/transcriptional regulator with XRE-family HTH domain
MRFYVKEKIKRMRDMGKRNDDILTHVEKFGEMVVKYRDKYGHFETFCEKIGASRASVNDWEKGKKANIQKASVRDAICFEFELNHRVWIDEFYDKPNFYDSLENYEEKELIMEENPKDKLDHLILGNSQKPSKDDENLLSDLNLKDKIDISEVLLLKKTPQFLFELLTLLKDKDQIDEALEILKVIQEDSSQFKYKYHNKLQHLKAVFLSHDSQRKWDEAIDILTYLYSTSDYFKQEPEIITLLASNYKRKALTDSSKENGWCEPHKIDHDSLGSAMILYRKAYELKYEKVKYYDAINRAYLFKIAEVLEDDETAPKRVEELYKDLTVNHRWRPTHNNWWEIITNAEFLMLVGKVDEAIKEVEDFLEAQDQKEFNMQTTIRQLELYIHFTDDQNAIDFCDHLKEIWKDCKLYK